MRRRALGLLFAILGPLSGIDVEPTDRLEALTVTVRAGETIDKLLRQMGIHPDGEALSAVYALNPDLEGLSPLAPGTKIVLPAAKERGTSGHPEIRLSVAAPTKKALLTVSQTLGPVVEKITSLPASRFNGLENREEIVGSLDEVRGFLDELNLRVKEGTRLFSPEMLRQSLAEARLVQSILEEFLRSGNALGNADRETIIAVSEDMNLKARSFDAAGAQGELPRRWRDVRIVVRVQGEGLRVYYVPRLLAKQKDAVNQSPITGPEVSVWLPEGDYLVWAGRERDTAPSTAQVPVQVRREREITVDLPIR